MGPSKMGSPMSTHTRPSASSSGWIRPAPGGGSVQVNVCQPVGEGAESPAAVICTHGAYTWYTSVSHGAYTIDAAWLRYVPHCYGPATSFADCWFAAIHCGQQCGQQSNPVVTCQGVYPVLFGLHAVHICNKARQAADAVAAHLRLRAVRVVDAHRQVCVTHGGQRKNDLAGVSGVRGWGRHSGAWCEMDLPIGRSGSGCLSAEWFLLSHATALPCP